MTTSIAGKTAGILLLLLGAATGATRGASEPDLEIRVLARSIVPGEAARVLVASREPLVSLRGTFAGRALFFQRHEPWLPPQDRELWSAWSVVDLGAKPGSRRVEIAGRAVSGKKVHATRTVRVLPKEFPTQRLRVESRYVTPPSEAEERIAREREHLAAVYATCTPIPPVSRPFLAPVPGSPSSPFGTRRILNGVPREPHPGIDLPAAEGDPVRAAGPGRVVVAAELYYSGRTVILDHGGGLFTLYGHLSRIDVNEKAWVESGQLLGLAGATGRATGPHLHWGAKVGDRPFDPSSLLDPALYRVR